MELSFKDPKERCFLTLLITSLLILAFTLSLSTAIVPFLFFLPLFLTARFRVLTPVTISISISISLGIMLIYSFFSFMGGHFYRGPEEFVGLSLMAGFLFSFFQAGIFSSYGFQSSLPKFYIAWGIILFLASAVMNGGGGVLLMPVFGVIYTLMANRALQRVKSREKK